MSEFTPKSKRLGRLIAAAPEMYELLSVIYRDKPPIAGDSRHDELCDALYKVGKLLARIDGEDSDTVVQTQEPNP